MLSITANSGKPEGADKTKGPPIFGHIVALLCFVVIGFGVLGCADQAKPDYDRCVQLERQGSLGPAVDACTAAVFANSTSTSGKAAKNLLVELRPKIDSWKAVEAARLAAAQKKSQEEDARRIVAEDCEKWFKYILREFGYNLEIQPGFMGNRVYSPPIYLPVESIFRELDEDDFAKRTLARGGVEYRYKNRKTVVLGTAFDGVAKAYIDKSPNKDYPGNIRLIAVKIEPAGRARVFRTSISFNTAVNGEHEIIILGDTATGHVEIEIVR